MAGEAAMSTNPYQSPRASNSRAPSRIGGVFGRYAATIGLLVAASICAGRTAWNSYSFHSEFTKHGELVFFAQSWLDYFSIPGLLFHATA